MKITWDFFNRSFFLNKKEKLSRVNVGQTYIVTSVNRLTREVILNEYLPEDWNIVDKEILEYIYKDELIKKD